MKLLVSPSVDPFFNLALEQYLSSQITEQSPVLFLWRNRGCVIIGRNQNPWRECNLPFMRKHKLRLCRRRSGGGAVFHDMGNVNFSFISTRSMYNREMNFAYVMSLLQSFGIDTQVNDVHDILVGDKKISGSAFRLTQHYACHHLTLLVDSKLDQLRGSLQASPHLYIDGRGIPSRPSSVTNLKRLNSQMSWHGICAYCRQHHPQHPDPDIAQDIASDGSKKPFMSIAWRFEQTAAFSCRIGNFEHFGAEIILSVQQGRIQSATAELSTSMESSVSASVREICARLEGRVFGARMSSIEDYVQKRLHQLPDLMQSILLGLDAALRIGI